MQDVALLDDARAQVDDPVVAFDQACDRAEAATAEMLDHLAEVDRSERWRAGGATCLTGWVAAHRRRAWSTAREWVRVARALRDLPAVAAAYRAGRISWDQLRPLTLFATPEIEMDWARRAWRLRPYALWREAARRRRVEPGRDADAHRRRYLSLQWEEDREALYLEGMVAAAQGTALQSALEGRARGIVLEEDVEDPRGARMADALVEAATGGAAGGPAVPTVVVHADASVVAGRGQTGVDGRMPLAESASGVPLPEEAIRRLVCDPRIEWVLEGDGRAVGIGRRGRVVPPWLARQVWFRDRGCRFPGCPRRMFVHIHHVVPWAEGGRTDLDNLAMLCGTHHRRVHEDGWTVRGHPDRELTFHPP